MLKLNIFVSILIISLNVCYAYKVLLVFPLPGKSHTILGEGYVKHLLKAGHEVTYVTPIPMKDPLPNLRQIDVSSNFNVMSPSTELSFDHLLKKEPVDILVVLDVTFSLVNGTIMHENVQKLLQDPDEKFDAVIVEWIYSEIYSGFSSVFDCPLIWSSSMEPHQMVLSLIDEDPNPTYMADIGSFDVPPFTFWQRAEQFWTFIKIKTAKWWVSGRDYETYKKAFGSAVAKRGRTLPPLEELKYNGSIMLGNSHVSSGQAICLPQNYKPIAGYHIDDVKPLPQDLQQIMDKAEHGVIYFSMGSILQSKTLPEELKRNFLKMFGGLKQTVLWKFEEQLENMPNNVHIVNWAPQQSILAHPNCILFITHGGLLSTTETLHFGVPIIGIPAFADQFTNMNRAAAKGFAKVVDLDLEMPANLKIAIGDMLRNSSYRDRAQELSLVYHDRVASPGAELVHWVEHAIRTRGAPHLRSPAFLVSWYQKLYFDLAALILVSIFVIVKVIEHFLISTLRGEAIKKKIS